MSNDLRKRVQMLEEAVLKLYADVEKTYKAKPELVPAGPHHVRMTGRMIGPKGFEPREKWCWCEDSNGIHESDRHSKFCIRLREYFRKFTPLPALLLLMPHAILLLAGSWRV